MLLPNYYTQSEASVKVGGQSYFFCHLSGCYHIVCLAGQRCTRRSNVEGGRGRNLHCLAPCLNLSNACEHASIHALNLERCGAWMFGKRK